MSASVQCGDMVSTGSGPWDWHRCPAKAKWWRPLREGKKRFACGRHKKKGFDWKPITADPTIMTLTHSQKRTIAQDAKLGMTWWNRLTERERAEWLRRADTAVPAEAWELFKRGAVQPTAERSADKRI